MSLRISLVNEQHGYTIRFEKVTFQGIPPASPTETAIVLATLAIVNDQKTAIEVFTALNNLIQNFIELKYVPEDWFRYGLPEKR